MNDETELIETSFPSMKGGVGYTITSDPTFVYNCLAWAIGDTAHWWDIQQRCAGYYWHPGAPREFTLASWRKIFADHGYSACSGDGWEVGFEKVAVYMASSDEPSHVARQLQNGRWTSKLGQSHDIEHASPALLEGVTYGNVVLLMKRPRPEWN